MKRLTSLLLAALMALTMLTPALAAQTPTVVYDGSAQLTYTDESGNTITGNGDFGNAFSQMLPGVEYSQSIVLRNTSASDTVKLFMNLGVLSTLRASNLDGAGYTVTLKTTSETLYSSINGDITGTLIGGSGSSGELADLNAALYSSDGTGILVATLAAGASETLTLTIQADATMSNAYQDANGEIEFQFFAERVESNGRITTIYVPGTTTVKTVQTGDTSPIYIVAGVLVLGVLILLFTGRKKKSKDEAAQKD